MTKIIFKNGKCSKCKKVIKKSEGHYTTPDGLFCIKCYDEKKPKPKKRKK